MVYKSVSKTSIYPHLHSSIVSMPRHKLAYVNPIMHYAKRGNVFTSVSSTVFQANSEHFLKIIIQDCECSNDDMCDNDKICKDDCYCLPRGNGNNTIS